MWCLSSMQLSIVGRASTRRVRVVVQHACDRQYYQVFVEVSMQAASKPCIPTDCQQCGTASSQNKLASVWQCMTRQCLAVDDQPVSGSA